MNKISSILLRYLIIVLIAIPNFGIIYWVFTPLTVYPVYWLLSLAYSIDLVENSLIIGDNAIVIGEACVAGAAYYLLIIINLAMPTRLKTRFKGLLFALTSLLFVNILRIVIFSILVVNDSSYFEMTHWIFWNILSTIFVFGIYLLEIRFYKIKEIPFYTDLSYIYKKIKWN